MQRRTTLQDVAVRAGVSRALVSIVMRDVPGASAATRARVRKAAEEIGYRPDSRARLLRSQRTRLLGLVFTAGQEFHAGLVDGVYRAAEEQGYDVLLSCVTPHRDEPRAVQTLLDDRCEGLVLIGTELSASVLTALDIPVVSVARRVRGVASVRSDDAGGAGIALDHLADLGHLAAVHVDGDRAPGAADRRRGFRTAARRRGMSATVVPGGLTEREGAAAAATLLASDTLPTAVFAFNDRCALGVLDVLIRAGIAVPEAVSVIGFDDSPLAAFSHIDLTTVGQDTARLADLAVSRLVARLDAAQPQVGDDVIAPRLIVRGTTAPPR